MEITQEQLNKLNKERLVNRYTYLGILNDYQTISKDLTQTIIYSQLNQYQHFLFKRVLHGLNIYTQEERKAMHYGKKKRITRVWKRAQRVINSWKQMICNKRSNEILQLFDNSPLAQHIMAEPVEATDRSFINNMDLKTLGIRYEDLIIKFISEGLLPKNFLTLQNVKA